MKTNSNAFILVMIASGPALLGGWYFTQANQFLYLLGLLEVVSIVIHLTGLAGLLYLVKTVEAEKLDTVMTDVTLALSNPLTYLSYTVGLTTLAGLFYFEHYVLTTLFLISLALSIFFRKVCKFTVKTIREGQ